jgi:hypothetical protein
MRYDELRGAIRIDVDQKDAEVYIDGYYAGTVDDFDGMFQRLRATAGGHQIVIRRDGFHSVKEDVYLAPDAVHRIRRTLQPLAAGEPDDPRPEPVVRPETAGPYPPMNAAPPPDRRRPPAGGPTAGAPRDARRDPESNYGTLLVRVQPDEAEILIDGEEWRGPEGDERLIVQLPEGRHRVEVRKSGFASFTTDVQVVRGETVTLNVSLARN